MIGRLLGFFSLVLPWGEVEELSQPHGVIAVFGNKKHVTKVLVKRLFVSGAVCHDLGVGVCKITMLFSRVHRHPPRECVGHGIADLMCLEVEAVA